MPRDVRKLCRDILPTNTVELFPDSTNDSVHVVIERY